MFLQICTASKVQARPPAQGHLPSLHRCHLPKHPKLHKVAPEMRSVIKYDQTYLVYHCQTNLCFAFKSSEYYESYESWDVSSRASFAFFVSHSVPCVELLTSYFDHSTLFNFMSTNMSIHWGEGVSTLGMHATHERSTLTPLCNKRPLPVEFERRDGFEREAFPPSLSWVELRAEAVSWVVQKSSTKITFCENAARDKK